MNSENLSCNGKRFISPIRHFFIAHLNLMMLEVIDPGNFAISNKPNTFTLTLFVADKRYSKILCDHFVENASKYVLDLNFEGRKEASVKMASDSSDGGSFDDIKDLLTCSLCSRTLNDPRILPCFHNFCQVCLGE